MATRIRLSRVGRKHQPSFRIVVAGSMHAAGGRVTETIGKYNPRTHPSYIEVNEERALYWLRQGAKMSESVGSLFRKTGVLKKLAEGAEGTGVVTIGDPNGKTITADRPGAKKSKKATAAEATAAAVPEAAAEEAAPEAEAEAGAAEAAAEPEAEQEKKDEGS
jgi:small subunit ribosomal protein S16